MTIHKVTAGDGYAYLTGQVASGDQLRARGQDPEDYYARTGEPPGYWLGQGAPGLGLTGQVDSAAMTALWSQNTGRHVNRVAGFDFTFSPAKSVSALWAVAPEPVQASIEAAHRRAVAESVAYMERAAGIVRINGRAHTPVPAIGFVVAAFEHRTSRTGDPDLHTHAAVLNRAQAASGEWRALFHPPLFEATVSASEFYNARLEDHLVADLGVAFAPVPRRNPALRPVREIVGVPAELMVAFSARRQQIEARAAAITADHNLNPTRSIRADARLHQWATLDTRTAKGPQRSLAERVAGWRATAEKVLGAGGVERMLDAVRQAVHVLDPRPLAQVARDIRARALRDRPNPKPLHIRAEAERQLRAHPDAIADRDTVVQTMQETVMGMVNPTVTAQQQQLLDLAALGARIRAAQAPGKPQQALTAAWDFYRQQTAGSWVPGYLQDRGLPTVDVGYAPGRTALVTHLRGLGFTDDTMIEAGLARKTDRGYLYDFFRDRMALPLRDTSGQVVGFTARKPPTDLNDAHPKYMNSPESAVFRKREVLFGLTPATLTALRAGGPVVLVEGPTDAMAVNVSRETSALAVCGTALTAEHLRALDGVAPIADRRIVLALDDDVAGNAATVKAARVLAEFGCTNVWAVEPGAIEGDPATMLQTQGPEALSHALAATVPVQDIVVDATLVKWPNPHGWSEPRINALHEVAPIIAVMPVAQRERQINRVGTALQLGEPAVRAQIHTHLLDLPKAPELRTARYEHRTPVAAYSRSVTW